MKKDRNRFDCLLATLSLESSSPVTAEISVEMLGLAERLQSAGDSTELDAATWLRYLEVTGSSPFLRALPLICALNRFQEWEHLNSHATPKAREEEVEQLFRLYRIDRFPEIVRYLLYRHTFFKHATELVLATFDCLLAQMFRQPDVRAVHLKELSDLQAALPDPLDRDVFSRMVFPRALTVQGLEVLAVGTSEHKQVIVRTEITDERGGSYAVREPVAPAEIGHLYRLFRESNYPKLISEREQHLIMTDEAEQVLGGLNYVLQDKDIVYLSGMVVAASLEGRGIAGVLLEDFLVRMAGRGIRLVKTDFFLRRFYTAHGFQVDPRWGGLVRRLTPD